ncbi:MAG: hypothetical protein C7B47_14390 [Sulfobacillus thermosulfidooxidans]|uniref:Uncharacterized protein n=1 Tax=Sulfobacillus thermosulfidooxidans TaxID=28034 RepID=A0A2T2WQV6_SULTH|nr:MAG: hypothetical protein C7B47_14390 [Sulfobacillus thermosulfidooxidans]
MKYNDTSLDPKDIERLTELVSHFQERERRAQKFSDTENRPALFFGILGIEPTNLPFVLADRVVLRPVPEPPGEVELARALMNRELFAAIGRYSHAIGSELVVYTDRFTTTESATNAAYCIVSGLRIRALINILVPAVIDRSWSAVAALNNEVVGRLIEDVPQAWRFESRQLNQGDWDWVMNHLISIAKLWEAPRFRVALESLVEHPHQRSLRMVAATLWAGIEALLDIDTELRFRLAAYLASVLEQRGPGRKELFAKVKKLYDKRSKAVHGGVIGAQALVDSIRETRVLLSRLLCVCVEQGHLFTGAELEDLLFL